MLNTFKSERTELHERAEELGRQFGSDEEKKLTEIAVRLSARSLEAWLFHALIHSDGQVTLGRLVDEGFPISTVKHLQTAMPPDEERVSMSEYIHAVKEQGGAVKDMMTARVQLNLFNLIESDGDQERIRMLELAVSVADGRPYNAKKRHEEIRAYTV